MRVFKGSFPVIFDPDGKLKWAFTEHGTLLEIDYNTGETKKLGKEICPHCQYVFTEFPFPVMEAIGQWKDWIHYDLLDHRLIRSCHMEDLDEKARIAGCARYGDKLFVIVTYTDHRETFLAQININHVEVLLGLKCRYRLHRPISISKKYGLAAFEYEEKGDIALFNLSAGLIENIIKIQFGYVRSLCFIDDLNILVSTHYGKKDNELVSYLNMWRIPSGEKTNELEVHYHWLTALAYSPSHYNLFALVNRPGKKSKIEPITKTVISAREYAIFAWNLKTGAKPKETIVGDDEEPANSIALSPDEKTLVSGEIHYYSLSEEEKLCILKSWDISELLGE
jgi:hypothetical protein